MGSTRAAAPAKKQEPRRGNLIAADLRIPEAASRSDGSARELDFEDVVLICPNGQPMRMSRWLVEQEPLIGTDFFFAPGGFSVSARPVGRESSASDDCVCDDKCKECPDGAYVCWDERFGECYTPLDPTTARARAESIRAPEEWEPYNDTVPTGPRPPPPPDDGGRPWGGSGDGPPPSDRSDPPGAGSSGGGTTGSGGSGTSSGGSPGGFGSGGGRGEGGRPGGL